MRHCESVTRLVVQDLRLCCNSFVPPAADSLTDRSRQLQSPRRTTFRSNELSSQLSLRASEEAVVYRGRARFGGEGRANPGLPPAQEVTSPNGQVLSWAGEFIDFRLTAPRRGRMPAFDTAGLNVADGRDVRGIDCRNIA